MSESNHKNTPPTTEANPLDLALAQLHAFVEGIEKERAAAEELAKVPDDVPRFVTRYGS